MLKAQLATLGGDRQGRGARREKIRSTRFRRRTSAATDKAQKLIEGLNAPKKTITEDFQTQAQAIEKAFKTQKEAIEKAAKDEIDGINTGLAAASRRMPRRGRRSLPLG